MRIGVNASIVDPILSGLGVYTVNVVRRLAELHDDLVVYTSWPEGCGVNSTKLRKVSPMVQPARGRRGHFRRVAWIQTALSLRLLADRVSLLLSPVPEGMLLPVVPQVIVVHDLIPLYLPESFPRQHLYFRYFVPAVLRRSRAIVADSESTKQDIVDRYGIAPGMIHVVACGYDQDRYRVGIDAESPRRKYGLQAYVLYVGNILPHKNLARLLDAFALLSERLPHTLVIAGKRDPRYHPALEAHARALGIGERIRFLDYVSPDDLPALYSGAEAFVLPSLHEGFGLPVLEAMACGTPVIASRAGSIPEVCGEAAVLIDPDDVQAMAGAIEAVLKDPAVREGMKRRGLERAARFTWERTALEILEVLREAADRRG